MVIGAVLKINNKLFAPDESVTKMYVSGAPFTNMD